MVQYFDINKAVAAYGAGQRGRKAVDDRKNAAEQKTLRNFVADLQGKGDYAGAAQALTRMGEFGQSLNYANQPLNTEFTQTRIDDVGIDNRRADQVFQANQAQRQFSNARAEAEARVNQGRGGNLTSTQRDYEYARQQGFPGSFLDYQEQSKGAGKQRMTAGDRRAILEADEAVYSGGNVVRALDEALQLNDRALSGLWAKPRAYVGSMLGIDSAEDAMQLDNLVMSQALQSLKSVFGGMPTEGERKILIEVQGSINQPPEVRKDILERARAAAQRRIEYNRGQAESIRTGDIYSPGYAPQAQPGAQGQRGMQNQTGPSQGGGTTSSGVQWEIE